MPDHTFTYALLIGNAHVYVFARIVGLNTCTCAFLKAVHICMYLPVSRVHIHAHMRFCAVAAQLHSRRIAVASPPLHRRRIAIASPSHRRRIAVASPSHRRRSALLRGRSRSAGDVRTSLKSVPSNFRTFASAAADPLHTEVEPQPWILGGATMRTLVRCMAESL